MSAVCTEMTNNCIQSLYELFNIYEYVNIYQPNNALTYNGERNTAFGMNSGIGFEKM